MFYSLTLSLSLPRTVRDSKLPLNLRISSFSLFSVFICFRTTFFTGDDAIKGEKTEDELETANSDESENRSEEAEPVDEAEEVETGTYQDPKSDSDTSDQFSLSSELAVSN